MRLSTPVAIRAVSARFGESRLRPHLALGAAPIPFATSRLLYILFVSEHWCGTASRLISGYLSCALFLSLLETEGISELVGTELARVTGIFMGHF